MNITTDFLKGAAGGGSFRCDSSLTQDLNNGVQMETRDLEYKAFNTDLNENFNGGRLSETCYYLCNCLCISEESWWTVVLMYADCVCVGRGD